MRVYFSKFKMSLSYFVLFFILSFPSHFTYANLNLQGQTPQVQFQGTTHNFGFIKQGQVMSHLFPFQNTGNGILVFTSLHASCGCLNARALSQNSATPKNIFKPGEKGMIAVDFNSSQFSGNVVRTVTVETNANDHQSSATLKLSANITEEISASPALLYLGKISRSSENTYTIKLNLKNSSLQTLRVESDLPFLEATLLHNKQNPQSEKLFIKITQKTSLPVGPFRGTITVKNTSKYYPDFKIPIMGEVIGHIEASSKFIEFGVVNTEKISERILSFESIDKNFSIKNIKIELNKLAYTKNLKEKDLFQITKVHSTYIKQGRSINHYKLALKLKYPNRYSAKTEKALLTGVNVSGSFVIETNDSDYTEIKVPFFGILKHEK